MKELCYLLPCPAGLSRAAGEAWGLHPLPSHHYSQKHTFFELRKNHNKSLRGGPSHSAQDGADMGHENAGSACLYDWSLELGSSRFKLYNPPP